MKSMQVLENAAPGALVAVLGGYTWITSIMQEGGGDVMKDIQGQFGALVLAVVVIGVLTKIVSYLRERLDTANADRVADLQARLEQVTKERNEYLHELLEEREEAATRRDEPRPARRRPSA